ncbi:androgen-dependent TFPI-regulating protein-like [Ornithodoros turicata]|uniref:Putative secreted protein n=1 Tax=Ornithodoros turicata TaxID=34597 RepID=A0A2R5LKB8_9ACAR
MKNTCVKTFHLTFCALYTYGVYFSEVHLDIPLRSPKFGIFGRYKYLTHWNLVLQAVMFTLFCVIDFAPIRHKRCLTSVRDHVFLSISLPLCMFVSTIFWTLFFIDRDLIFPEALEMFYPAWLNHLSHTAITFSAIVEALVNHHKQPTRKTGFATLLMFAGVYLALIQYLGLVHGIWVYPVLEVLSSVAFCAFLGFCIFFIFVFYVIGEKLNTCFWPQGRKCSKEQ